MNEQIKTELAISNGFDDSEKRRKELTAQEIGKLYPLSKEIGMLGDAVEYLFERVSQLHEDVEIDPAFIAWRKKVADIKQSIKEEIDSLSNI